MGDFGKKTIIGAIIFALFGLGKGILKFTEKSLLKESVIGADKLLLKESIVGADKLLIKESIQFADKRAVKETIEVIGENSVRSIKVPAKFNFANTCKKCFAVPAALFPQEAYSSYLENESSDIIESKEPIGGEKQDIENKYKELQISIVKKKQLPTECAEVFVKVLKDKNKNAKYNTQLQLIELYKNKKCIPNCCHDRACSYCPN